MILAPLCAIIVALFSKMNVLETMSGVYMPGFATFFQNFFLLFALSSIFAKLISDAGVSKVIAVTIAGAVRRAKPERQKLYAVLSTALITAVLTLGGVNLYCCVFLIAAISKDLFEEFDIPWHMYMCSCIGSGSFTMSMFPGTPSMQNLIPIQYLGTSASAAPVLGLIGTVICIVLSVIYVRWQISGIEKRDEHFLPTGAEIKQLDFDMGGEPNKISLFRCLVPSIILLLALNVAKLPALTSMAIADVCAIVVFWKEYKINKVNLIESTTEGFKSAIMVVATICVLTGFGAVVSNSPGFTLIMGSLDHIPGPPIVQLVIAINVAAGIAGSASAGLGVGLNLFAQRFIDMGISPDVIHRMAVISSGGLDNLPHSSGVATALGVAHLKYSDAYKHGFALNCVVPLIVTIVLTILVALGVTF
ncbi:MAG: GntP family permease [Anaerovoracaceae bacterium]